MSTAKQDTAAIEGLHFLDDMTESHKKASTMMLLGSTSRNVHKKMNG